MAYTYKIKQGSTEVKTGTTTTDEFSYDFPENTGTTDIEYTITVEDDNGCTATKTVTVSSGSECQETSTDNFYIMVSSACGIPDGTVFSIEFMDCGVKEYVTTGDNINAIVEFEGTSDCDYKNLMEDAIRINYPVGTSDVIELDIDNLNKGDGFEIKGYAETSYYTINNLFISRIVNNSDDTSTIYCKFTLSADNVLKPRLEIRSEVYIKETFHIDCELAETGGYRQITTEPDYDNDYIEDGFAGTSSFYTKEFEVATLQNYTTCKGDRKPITFTVTTHKDDVLYDISGDVCVNYSFR